MQKLRGLGAHTVTISESQRLAIVRGVLARCQRLGISQEEASRQMGFTSEWWSFKSGDQRSTQETAAAIARWLHDTKPKEAA